MSKQKTVAYVRSNSIYLDSRATKEIRSLLKNGYSVIVIGWDRDGCALQKNQELFKEYQNIEFYFYSQPIHKKVGLKNINKMLRWFRFVKRTLKLLHSKIDIVHACDLDAGLPARPLCKKYKKKLVYDIYDYYVDAHRMFGVLSGIVERMEIKVINSADCTIICTDERMIQLSKSKPKKVIVIHNSPQVDFIKSKIEYDYFYCGFFAEKRLIKEILNEYHNFNDLKMCFAGFGTYQDDILSLAQKYDNVSYIGKILYDKCLQEEAKALCLSAIYEPTVRNHQLCAPNKFYESLALGKPVIVCRGTGIDQIVEKYNLGKVINYDAKEFYEAIEYFKTHSKETKEIGIRARQLYEEKYSWDIMEKVLIEFYDSIK